MNGQGFDENLLSVADDSTLPFYYLLAGDFLTSIE